MKIQDYHVFFLKMCLCLDTFITAFIQVYVYYKSFIIYYKTDDTTTQQFLLNTDNDNF